MGIDKVQDGVAYGLAYNGTQYNAAIHKCALAMAGVLEDPGQTVMKALTGLELQYGRDIISSEYSKLSKLIAYGKSVSTSWSLVQGPKSSTEIIAWMLDMLVLSFKTKLRQPNKATESWLDKDRKSGLPGFWPSLCLILQAHVAFLKSFNYPSLFLFEHYFHGRFLTPCLFWWRVPCQAFEYAEKLLSKLSEPEQTKAVGVLTDLLTPGCCWNKFLKPDEKTVDENASFNEDDLEADNAIVVPAGPLAAVKESFNKATGMLFDLLLNLMSGALFSDCQALASQAGGLVKALQEEAQADELDFVKQVRLVTEMFEGHSKSVAASSTAPVPSLLSQLTSGGQVDTEADADRERTWKAVQAERRKFVSFGVPKTWSKDGLLQAFRASGKVHGHSGSLNSSHRLICASADLITEHGEEPWSNASVPPLPLWKEIIAFMNMSASGPADFLMAFDGRMREVRRVNAAWIIYFVLIVAVLNCDFCCCCCLIQNYEAAQEDEILNQPHASEATIVYCGGCPPRCGRSRRVPLGGRKVETMALRCPVIRNRLKAMKKESFTACGEKSTYQGTYTNVSFRNTFEIPLIAPAEKAKVLDPNSVVSMPKLPDDWTEKNGEDCPMYWQEAKPIALWCAILDEWCIQAILDCTPGSGALMEAALTRGITYHGLCSSLSCFCSLGRLL